MNVREFIKWLDKQDQELEVCVVEYQEYGDWGYDGENEVYVDVTTANAVCFDDPSRQSQTTDYSLILGVEK
jgi:hypothetical protein